MKAMISTAMDLSNSKYKDDDAPEKNSDTEENEGPHWVSVSICDSSDGDLIDGKDEEFILEESDTEDEEEW